MFLRQRYWFDALFVVGVAFAALVFIVADVLNLVGVVREEVLAGLVGAVFVDGEVGVYFVLEAEFPFVGAGGVVFPEAGVGDGE